MEHASKRSAPVGRRRRSLAIGLALALLVAAACDEARRDPEAGAPSAAAQSLRLPRVFGDSMVLQRDAAVPVWGRATPGETVSVRFGEQSHSVPASADGRWMIQLAPMPASADPRRLTVSMATAEAKQLLQFENVIVGDVYLAGGQSNMGINLAASLHGPAEIPLATHPNLRFINVRAVTSPDGPEDDLDGQWAVCSPRTAARISAVAYFFAQMLQAETGVPIGVIHASRGNSSAESWLPRDALRASLEGRAYTRAWEAAQRGYDPAQARARDERRMADYGEKVVAARAAGRKINPQKLRRPRPTVAPRRHIGWPGTLYNGTIAPLQPFALRGVIWYHGERDARHRGFGYRVALTTLIEQWRRGFGNPSLPFYIVQLADWARPSAEPGDSAIAEAREAQLRVHRELPNTGLAVIIDTGEGGSTHPRNKRLPGVRLALWALAREYGSDVEFSGPLYESMRREGGRIVLSFDHVGGGLMAGARAGPVAATPVQEPLRSFAIAGADREFVWAEAEIRGDEVAVWSQQVPEPVAVRYAWADNPAGCNLYNRAGLPASPFRTDRWPGVTEGVLDPHLPEGYRPGAAAAEPW
jgi:sialate O-acetylesterase